MYRFFWRRQLGKVYMKVFAAEGYSPVHPRHDVLVQEVPKESCSLGMLH